MRVEAIRILKRVFEDQAHADILIDQTFQKCSLPSSDRSLLSELVYGTIRWKGQLDWILSIRYKGKWNKVPRNIQRNLEVALYQIRYLDKVPSYAAINEAVEAAKKVSVYWGSVVNALLRGILREPKVDFPDRIENPIQAIAVEFSHPEWLVERWIEQFGMNRTIALCRANNQRPTVCIRLNRLKGEISDLLEKMKADGLNPRPGKYLEDYYTLEDASGFQHTDAFNEGLFTVQDESAGLVGLLTDPQPGERILDLAAAPGGKTVHMAQLSRNQSMITSVDKHPKRLRQVVENCARLGIHNVHCNADNGLNFKEKPFDKVLLDAPCSGLGVLRKRGELRWRMNEATIQELTKIQMELLTHASILVKQGGLLVYSTCTVTPDENNDLIQRFIRENPSFQIEDARPFVPEIFVTSESCVETWTDLHDIDGAFAVRMRKTR